MSPFEYSENPIIFFSANVLSGILVGLFVNIFSFGLINSITTTKTTPNQGIRLSAKNALIFGVLSMIVTAASIFIIMNQPNLTNYSSHFFGLYFLGDLQEEYVLP
jgi:hypothetical protein